MQFSTLMRHTGNARNFYYAPPETLTTEPVPHKPESTALPYFLTAPLTTVTCDHDYGVPHDTVFGPLLYN